MILRMASIYLIEAIGLNKEKVLECLLKHGLKRNVPATIIDQKLGSDKLIIEVRFRCKICF